MKVHLLRSRSAVYSGNAYLVLGEWNRLCDVNALVDAGTDGSIIDAIAGIWTGVGKRPVERVVLTHSHFDHAGGLSKIVSAYQPEVCVHASVEGAGRRLAADERVLLGDEEFQVMYAPEHSSDSICLYSARSRVLFSGDTPIALRSGGGTYDERFEMLLEDLLSMGVETIYSGHDEPVLKDAQATIRHSLEIVRQGSKGGRSEVCRELTLRL